MGDHGGSTTAGQWLDGQTGQVAHNLLGEWDGDEIWTSDAGCMPSGEVWTPKNW
jgi:hypothetical protein